MFGQDRKSPLMHEENDHYVYQTDELDEDEDIEQSREPYILLSAFNFTLSSSFVMQLMMLVLEFVLVGVSKNSPMIKIAVTYTIMSFVMLFTIALGYYSSKGAKSIIHQQRLSSVSPQLRSNPEQLESFTPAPQSTQNFLLVFSVVNILFILGYCVSLYFTTSLMKLYDDSICTDPSWEKYWKESDLLTCEDKNLNVHHACAGFIAFVIPEMITMILTVVIALMLRKNGSTTIYQL
eukprot:TRINITY_DN4795_c0_g1_i2.p1 TRINITY_DN4795_c0_g1~~TRINITY_DN4795_c0_g1_i2.p1  ORF type:complete len:236 (+),score=45.27 TRINITY_DN4795_c0_g1_i2:167-874(+)